MNEKEWKKWLKNLPPPQDAKAKEWQDSLKNKQPHNCFWCNELTYSWSWACKECYPKKEAAYQEARENGIVNRDEIMTMAFEKCNDKPKKSKKHSSINIFK